MQHPDDLQLFTAKAELLKSIAHPVRLCIARGLIEQGECNVNKIQECLALPQSTVSQHLGKLREQGIVRGRRQGIEVYYQVVNEDVRRIVKALFPKG